MPSKVFHPWFVLALALVLTLVVYWPSLHGGFIFDDAYYVEKSDIHVTTLRLGDWVAAALSQAGTNQFRALSMLSFATNYYFTGLDPFWLKLTNVAIHLLNGLLLFLMLRELFRMWTVTRRVTHTEQVVSPAREMDLIAVIAAGAWLLLPINLTGVAYVSQRLESLANVFVFLGLFWYLRARRRPYAGHRGGAMLWISLAVCMALGFCAKESAALLPLYTACVELAITGFRNQDGRYSRPALWTHLVLLVFPLVAGLVWISQWNFKIVANVRTFSIGERLLTEPRILIDYIQWTLLPSLSSLSFYHDDILKSRALLDPPTTLMAILALLGLLSIALWQRKRRPLFCLGILWFFAGHAMTATIIPLELVFEHRNYFPSMGLLLAATSLFALEPGLRPPAAKALLATGFIAFFAFTTFLRAEEWSNPLRLALSEAGKRPESMRAQYELAYTFIAVAGSDEKSPLIPEAKNVLESIAFRPDSGTAPLQALIFLNGRAHLPVDPAWWPALIEKLQKQPPSQTDASVLIFLLHCQRRGDCPPQKSELLDAFVTALTKSAGDVNLMSAYADFAHLELGDAPLAERMLREVVAKKPTVPVYHANLIKLLIETGQFDAAESALVPLRQLNRLGSLDPMLHELQTLLDEGRVTAAGERGKTVPAPSADISGKPEGPPPQPPAGGY